MDNETIPQSKVLALLDVDRFLGDNTRIHHPDVAGIVPSGRRIIGVLEDGNADSFSRFEFDGVIIPGGGGPVKIGDGVMRIG